MWIPAVLVNNEIVTPLCGVVLGNFNPDNGGRKFL
jgi:hypothetical protein